MSGHMRLEAIKPPDAKWKKMKAAWDACEAAGVEPPDDVLEFFDHEEPNEHGVVMDLLDFDEPGHESVSEVEEDMTDGYYVDLTKLPKDVTMLRFTMSY